MRRREEIKEDGDEFLRLLFCGSQRNEKLKTLSSYRGNRTAQKVGRVKSIFNFECL